MFPYMETSCNEQNKTFHGHALTDIVFIKGRCMIFMGLFLADLEQVTLKSQLQVHH